MTPSSSLKHILVPALIATTMAALALPGMAEARSRPCEGNQTEGAVLTEADLAFKKPGDGIPAARWRDVLGKRVKRAIPADRKLAFEDLT